MKKKDCFFHVAPLQTQTHICECARKKFMFAKFSFHSANKENSAN